MPAAPVTVPGPQQTEEFIRPVHTERIELASVDQKATFKIPELPAGDYFVDVKLLAGDKSVNWAAATYTSAPPIVISAMECTPDKIDCSTCRKGGDLRPCPVQHQDRGQRLGGLRAVGQLRSVAGGEKGQGGPRRRRGEQFLGNRPGRHRLRPAEGAGRAQNDGPAEGDEREGGEPDHAPPAISRLHVLRMGDAVSAITSSGR